MSYTTFAQLLKWLEIPAQKQIKSHRRDLVRLANQIRRELYSMYAEVPMNIDVSECFAVQSFCLDCHDCASSYSGITLTNEMDGLESIFLSSEPIKYFSRWREQSMGMSVGTQCRFEAIDQGAVFPFELDAGCCQGCCIAFRAQFSEDNNKEVTVRYTDTAGYDRHEKILLAEGQWMKTTYPAQKFHLPGAIVLPDLCGPVVVGSVSGDTITEISRYAPWERVPAYRRVKILGVEPGQRVLVKANRKFHDLYFDDEIVETDNERAWINLANYVTMHDLKNDNPNQMNIAKAYLADAKRLLVGDRSRSRGGLQETQFKLHPRKVTRSKLASRR
jgi:hypothetical protein